MTMRGVHGARRVGVSRLLVVLSLGALLLTGVVAIGDSRSMLWIAAVGLAVNIGLNAWLVPAYGIT